MIETDNKKSETSGEAVYMIASVQCYLRRNCTVFHIEISCIISDSVAQQRLLRNAFHEYNMELERRLWRS